MAKSSQPFQTGEGRIPDDLRSLRTHSQSGISRRQDQFGCMVTVRIRVTADERCGGVVETGARERTEAPPACVVIVM